MEGKGKGQVRGCWKSWRKRWILESFNPFTLKSDRLQFSLSVSHQRYIIQYEEFGNQYFAQMKVDWTIIPHYITQWFSSWMVGRICIMSLELKVLKTLSTFKLCKRLFWFWSNGNNCFLQFNEKRGIFKFLTAKYENRDSGADLITSCSSFCSSEKFMSLALSKN